MLTLKTALVAAIATVIAAAGALACWGNAALSDSWIWFVAVSLLGGVVTTIALVTEIARGRVRGGK